MSDSFINSLGVNAILHNIIDTQTALVSLAVVIFYILKDEYALRYALLCWVFYVIGYFTSEPIRSIDDEKIYRYIFWALNDIVFIAIVAYWALKDKMYMWQSIACQLIVIPAPILQLFRLVDRQLMDLSYSGYLYKTILPLVNYATVFLCFVPLIYVLGKNRKTNKVTEETS
ncbi:hypothetical protein CWB99_07915 [Pseudoalteromonas rubra]|uniref:Uncharacterized protein n=1 Tax=Pseudoalteromonas rubra TaxID=43658 RepID=A0A5S3WQ56_9GAMM|nr:hypothetical protein [Pseudoalteromonas rubra]TMP29528.1 hypothetical protein CWB99_07915 [Pseudoalteromonas rubra]TMP35122.1 hypothetical protein CWC00_04880 [Pseudoalteromonas rubra]